MCWCSGFAGAGWGAPWMMFLMPVFFLLIMLLICRSFRPWFAGCCGHGPASGGHWTREIEDLRRDVDELRKDTKKP